MKRIGEAGLMSQDAAETLALQALGWLVADPDLLNVFMGSTGLGEIDLRTRATERDILVAVLDFIVMDDNWVRDFCDGQSLAYDMVMRARAALAGGEVHWT